MKPKHPLLVAAMAMLEATKAEVAAQRADIRAERAALQAAAESELMAMVEPLMRKANARDQAEKRIREAATILSDNGLDGELEALATAFPWVFETASGFQRLGHVDMLLLGLNKEGHARSAIVAAMERSGTLSPGQPADQLTKLRVRLKDAKRRVIGSMGVMLAMRPELKDPEVGAWIDRRAANVERLSLAAVAAQRRAVEEERRAEATAETKRLTEALAAWHRKQRPA